jgi:hypothetical protein
MFTRLTVIFVAICAALSCFIVLSAGHARAEAPADVGPVTAEEQAPHEEVGEAGKDVGPEGEAAAEPGSITGGDEAVSEETREKRGAVDVVHATISRGVLGTADWLDSFFDDPRYQVEENRTRVKVGLDYFLEEGSGPDISVPISVKIALPHFQKKARIVVVGTPDNDLEAQTGVAGTAVSRLPGAQENNVTTAFDYFFKATDRKNVAVRVGVRFREGEPELFVQPRYRLLIPLDPWALRFTQSFRWWTEFGWEEATTVDLERTVGTDLFFRTTVQGAWAQEEHGYLYSLSFVLRQPLSPRHALQYEWINNFETRPKNQAVEYLAIVRYRQKIWRDWLFYEIAPQARFPRDRDFDFTPGILFRLEMIFGRYEGMGV